MNPGIPLRQHIKLVYNVCLHVFVVLNASDGRQVHKSNNCVSIYSALLGIQRQCGRVGWGRY